MAVSKCQDCGRDVSETLVNCPNCGRRARSNGPAIVPDIAKKTSANEAATLLAVGIPLTLVLTWFVVSTGLPGRFSDRPGPGGTRVDALAAPVEPVQTEPARTVRFLRSMFAASQAAGDACFGATRCGYVKLQGSRGEVQSTAEIAPCLEARIPICATAINALKAGEPPTQIADDWNNWVRVTYADNVAESRVLTEILKTTTVPKQLRANGELFDGLIDWANAKHLAPAAAYFTRDNTALNEMETAEKRILSHLPGVCAQGVFCTVSKVMHGAPGDVNQPYMVLRR